MLVHHHLEQSARRLPDKTALICGDRRLSYRQIDEAADRVAATLLELGLQRQDRVVIYLENSPEAVISLYGILKAGGVFVLLNPGMKAAKLGFILNDCGAKAIITHRTKTSLINEAVTNAPCLESILWCGGGPHASPAELLPAGRTSVFWEPRIEERDPVPPPAVGTIDIDLATLIYTSGSTGEPKGVVSAHYNMTAAIRSITAYLENTEDDIVLNALPLSFDYGLYQVLMAFSYGGTVVLEKSFAFPYRIMERLAQERVTGFPIVPTMIALLLQMDPANFDMSSVRYLTNTGAALPVPYIRRFRELFPNVRIFSMYGLTECKRALWLPPEEVDRRPGSVGMPIPNEEAFVVDDQGREVPPGEIGELVIRGSNVMQGYWNRPEETARYFRPGRYRGETLLYTGDLFRRDEEGYLYFVARKDDLIKTKGERVSPKEIENVLCALEGVAEAAVIGVPDEIFGQAIKAFIVPAPEARPTEEEVLRHCARHLEPFMIPKFVVFQGSLPKSPSGKVDKKTLSGAQPLAQDSSATASAPAG